jgi:hypothetical protein
MADEADVANDHVQKTLDLTMRSVNTNVPKNDTGECIWCGSAIKEKDGTPMVQCKCRDEHQLLRLINYDNQSR